MKEGYGIRSKERPEVLLILGEESGREEEQAQRNANGHVGLDMQRKKYLCRVHRG